MLGPLEKSFFMHTAMGARELSSFEPKRGAVLTKDKQLLSYGFNRRIIKNEGWEMSAVYDAIFGARSQDLSGAILFSTYFPSVDDFKLITSVGILSLNFTGIVEDVDSVRFLNAINSNSIPLEIIHLENN